MVSIAKKIIAAATSAAIVVSTIPVAFAWSSQDSTAIASASNDGFVYAEGTEFMLDGSTYYYAGTNCYYLTFKSKEAVDNVFDDAEAMGLKVIRTWGNIDVGVITDQVNSETGAPVFTDNNDGSGEKDGYYFQYFDPELGKPVVNEGENGLQSLDYAIYQAEKHDMKLLITFTNYWDAFGGMGQYIKWAKQIGLTNLVKDDFYTNETIKQWYKDYVYTLLNHTNVYTGRQLKDEPAVFAWELANEPRCSTDPQAENDVLYNWAKEMSEYVKSIDSNHMVSVGDEGFFNKEYGYYNDITTSNYPFYGAEGVDFEKLMTIDTIDFGTPHLYLDQWGLKHTGTGQDDLLWFKMHGEYCAEIGKPVILEEFGLTDKTIRDSEYAQWFEVLEGEVYENVEYAGTNYWMIASYVDGALYPDYDGYTVYGPEGTVTESTRQLIMEHAANMEAKNKRNSVSCDISVYDRATMNSDITLNLTIYTGEVSGVQINGKDLSSSDYTVNGSTITIKSSCLEELESQKLKFTVLFTQGKCPSCTVTLTDSSVTDAEISPTLVTYDQNPRVGTDVEVSVTDNGNTFKGIYNSDTNVYLTEGTDYTVSGDKVTLSTAYLNTLEEDETAELAFDFAPGNDKYLTINVTDTSDIDGLDSFDDYESDDDLWSAYSMNTSGNEVGLSLVQKNGSQALAFSYNVGDPSYCGVNHPITKRDVSSFKGVQLWIQGDGSGNTFTIQLRDGNDKYFEKEMTIDFTDGRTIQIPFDEFTAPSWQGEGTLDTTSVNQFSIYAGSKGSTTTGTYYIDDMFFYTDGTIVEEEGAYLTTTSGSFDGSNPASVLVTMYLGGAKIDSVTCGGKTLDSSSDYSWNGSQVMLNTTFLKTLSNGTASIIFNFSDGNSDTFTLTVSNNGETEEHTHEYTSVTVDATCTEAGSTTYTCECGDTYTETIAAAGHSYEVEEATATCTTAGYAKYTCSVCGDSYTEEGSALGHDYTDKVVAPTETAQGYTEHTCTRCGDSYKDSYTDYVKPDDDDDDDAKETVIYSGSVTGNAWNQILSLNTVKNSGDLDPAVFTKGGYLKAEISAVESGTNIILQSWSGGPGWQCLEPTEYGSGYAIWSYDDIVAAYGSSDLSTLDRLHVMNVSSEITLTKLSYFGEGASVEEEEEEKPVPPVVEEEEEEENNENYIQYFYGSSSCSGWGQAVGINTAKNGGEINVSDIVKNGYFYVEYTGDMDKIELIFESWSGGNSWCRMSPTETGTCENGYYAKWSYDSIISAYGSDLSTVDKVFIGDADGYITVYKLMYIY